MKKPPTTPPTDPEGIMKWQERYTEILTDGMNAMNTAMQQCHAAGYIVQSTHTEHKALRGLPLISIEVYKRIM